MAGSAALALLCAAGVALWSHASADEGEPACRPRARPALYPDVQPIFARHCAKCHDSRKGENRAAQLVFEMSRYPFSTARPDTLLGDLRGMFISRGNLSRTEKCTGLSWIDGGGRDAQGRPPRWRKPDSSEPAETGATRR
jgi:hypothetical protein